MTRFQIIGIFDDKICTSVEFDGKGYFTGNGHIVCEGFIKAKNFTDYKNIIKKMNDDFGYREELIYDNVKEEEFNFYKLGQEYKYFDIWFSDYLYIKNFTKKDKIVVDENRLKITVHPGGWVTINFGKFYITREEDKQFNALPCNNIKIDNVGFITDICEKFGWSVTEESDNCLYISKYSRAGEDFGFSVSKEDAIKEIIQYADDFDVDEHVKMWIDGPGAPTSIRALLEDAEDIEQDLDELADAFKKGK